MKIQILIIASLVSILLAFKLFNYSQDFSGKWHTETANSEFDLDLIQKNNALSGSHCSVQNSGNKIDCVLEDTDISIVGIVSGSSTVTVTFTSQMSFKKGTAKITKINDSTIEWEIITKPRGEFQIPSRATLKKNKF